MDDEPHAAVDVEINEIEWMKHLTQGAGFISAGTVLVAGGAKIRRRNHT
jgi:hypothetical protein